MSSSHEVISAFLDDEPFDSEELANALSDPAGRALLIDLIALRRIVQPAEAAPPIGAASLVRPRRWRAAAAAAMLLLALGGGYLVGVGERRAVTTPSEAPTPTRIVEAVPFVPSGGMR
jgi:hypothetical protein